MLDGNGLFRLAATITALACLAVVMLVMQVLPVNSVLIMHMTKRSSTGSAASQLHLYSFAFASRKTSLLTIVGRMEVGHRSRQGPLHWLRRPISSTAPT